MEPSRIISIAFSILAFAATESALAACLDPAPIGSICCGYVVSVGPPNDAAGLPATEKATGSQMVGSLAQCLAVAQPVHDKEAVRHGCLLPSYGTFYDAPYTDATLNFRMHGFRNEYFKPHPTSWSLTIPCVNMRGVTATKLPPPPPPPPPPPVACNIGNMPSIPTADSCTNSLEANNGLPGLNSNCPPVPVMTRIGGEPCFRGKVGLLGVAYNAPTSTIRTVAYQKHLKDVWDYYWTHQWLINDPVQYQACTAKRTAVTAEMNKHGVVYPPVGTSHNDGTAFDVSQTVIAGIKHARVPRMLTSPTACTLGWGGTYKRSPPDPVHFFLNVP